MSFRRSAIGALALTAVLAACDKQAAGPGVDTESESAGIQALVRTDTTSTGTTPSNFAVRSGINVNLYRQGEDIVLRRQTTNAQGKVTFRGLEPGTYVLRPSVRDFTFFGENQFAVVQARAGRIDSTTVFRFRQGARLTGFAQVTVTNQDRFIQQRVGQGVEVELQRDTSAAQTGKFVRIAVDTTDASGAYEFVVPVFGPQRYRVRYVLAQTGLPEGVTAADLRFAVTPDTADGQQFASADTIRRTVLGGLPGGTSTQNFPFEYTSRIAGQVFRDLNGSGTKDAGEDLIAGDTIVLQLRNATGERVLQTQRVSAGTAASSGIGRPAQGYSFTSLEPGTYLITVAPAATRFNFLPVTPQTFPTGEVVVGSRTAQMTLNVPVDPIP